MARRQSDRGDLFGNEPPGNWDAKFLPLIEKYKDTPHPLLYKNLYQLMVMVILSAQDSDRHINQVAPPFFTAFPDFAAVARVGPEALHPYLSGVRNFRNKCVWLRKTATKLASGKVSLKMEDLTSLDGIGRKSANVIRREMKEVAEGVIVDLHVLRVIPRLGISQAKDGTRMEKDLMQTLSKSIWHHVGMCISFLGRETCRPSNPRCGECVMQAHCAFANP
jgi:endonuclease III